MLGSKESFSFMHQREARFVQLHLLNTVLQRLLRIKYKYRVPKPTGLIS